MFENVLPARSDKLLKDLAHSGLLENFYLAGGTAAALQLGHRLSEDLDFFTDRDFDSLALERTIQPFGQIMIANQEEGSLTVKLAEVKVSWLKYPYPLVEATSDFLGVSVAALFDIGLMKLTAVSSRGSRRDFIDLLVISGQVGGLERLIDGMAAKFPGVSYSRAHLLKSLVYFEDAESEPEPRLLIDLEWPVVKQFFEQQVKNLIKG